MSHRLLSSGLLITLTCVTAAATASTAIPTDNPKRTAMDKAVDAAATRFFANSCHAGLSVSVVTADGDRVYDYGTTDRSNNRLPEPDSVYEIASVTKSFTASLAAYAVHEHKMTLNGDFRRYLNTSYPNLAMGGNPITLATLLTHRSGMPRDIPDTDAIFAAKDPRTLPTQLLEASRGQDEATFLRALHDTPLRSKPGSEERYSNAGFIVIGAGLEYTYGMPYAELLRKKILGPLGMASTTLTLNTEQEARRVKGYDVLGRPTPYHPANAGAAWGIWSTPADLSRYVRWQLSQTDPVVQLSHQPLVHTEDEDVAMAWHLEQVHGNPLISHGGGSFGTSSQVVLFPKRRQGFALVANDTCKGTEGSLKQLAIEASDQAPH